MKKLLAVISTLSLFASSGAWAAGINFNDTTAQALAGVVTGIADSGGTTYVSTTETANTIVAKANQTGTGIIQTWKDGADATVMTLTGNELQMGAKKIYFSEQTNSHNRIYSSGKSLYLESSDSSGGIVMEGRDYSFENQVGTVTYADIRTQSSEFGALISFDMKDSILIAEKITANTSSSGGAAERFHVEIAGGGKSGSGDGLRGGDVIIRGGKVISSASGNNHFGGDVYIDGGYPDKTGPTEGNIFIGSSYGNVGIGTASPTAKLHTQGTLSEALTGTVSVTLGTDAVTGAGTAFDTELSVGDSIKIEDEVFTVSAIGSATTLTLDSNHVAGASGATAYSDPDLFRVDNGDSVEKFSIDKSGDVAFSNISTLRFNDVGAGARSPVTLTHDRGYQGGLVFNIESSNTHYVFDMNNVQKFKIDLNGIYSNEKTTFYKDAFISYGNNTYSLMASTGATGGNVRLLSPYTGLGGHSNGFKMNSSHYKAGEGDFSSEQYTRFAVSDYGGITFNSSGTDRRNIFEVNAREQSNDNFLLTNGSPNVTTDADGYLNSTDFAQEYSVGESITIDGGSYTVQSITDQDNMVLTTTFTGTTGSYYILKTDYLDYLTVQGAGNIGIGVAVPDERLHVDGVVHLEQVTAPTTTTDKLYNVGGALTWNGADLMAGGVSGAVQFSDGAGGFSSDNTNYHWDDTNKRLGLGSASPGGRLVVVGEGLTNATYGLNVTDSGGSSNFFVRDDGNVGIGLTGPTSLLHLAAGTATAGTAPLKFTSGTNLTTPEAGVMEFDGTDLFFTPSATRKTVAFTEDLAATSFVTVGTGGDYASVEAFLENTNGDTHGRVISAITEAGGDSILATDAVRIVDLQGYSVDFQTNVIYVSNANRVHFKNGDIVFADGSAVFFKGATKENLLVENVYILNNSTASSRSIAGSGVFESCKFEGGAYDYSLFKNFVGSINNSELVASGQVYGINMREGSALTNSKITGVMGLVWTLRNARNVTIDVTGTTARWNIVNSSNIQDLNGNIDLVTFKNVTDSTFENINTTFSSPASLGNNARCTFTAATTIEGGSCTDCIFNESVTISDNNVTLTNPQVGSVNAGAKTITANAGVTGTVIMMPITEASIVDTSGVAQIIAPRLW